MTHNLGEKLRSLRKKNDLTQEQLAERLGVSFQSISKWETNAAVPDVSMFPVLANFYRVTTDELLGVDIALADDKIKQYGDEIYRLLGEWKLAEAVETARRACSEFPGSDNLRYLLAHAIESAQNVIRTKEENLAEIISILSRILETSTDTDLRLGSQAMLVRAYRNSGDDEKAIEYAEGLPGLFQTRQRQMIRMGLKKGAERAQYVRNVIGSYYDGICEGVRSLCGIWPYDEADILPPEEQIALLDSMLALQSVIFGSELLGENMNAMQYAYTKAALYCRIGDSDAALDELERAVSYAEGFAAYNEDTCYASPMRNGCETVPHTFWSQSAFDDLYDELYESGKEKYAVLHNTSRYKAIAEKVGRSCAKM